MSRVITPRAPLSTLVHALARVAWGPLAGAANRPARIILEVLAGHARHCNLDRAGEVVITARQVADLSGYSERHIRRWLPILEGLDLITWKRGHIVDGRPTPGVMRVNKNVIARWVRDYRAKNDARLEERKAQTLERLKGLRLLRIPPVVPRWKQRADMMTSLPPSLRGEQGGYTPRPLPKGGGSPLKSNYSAQPSKTVKVNDMPFHDYIPDECIHRIGNDPWKCNACRSKAMQDEQAALNAQRRARAAAAEAAEREAEERQDRWQAYMDATYPGTSHVDKARIMQSHADPYAQALLDGVV